MITLDPNNPPKLARLIATEEGFYVLGSIPNRFNNPGDLEHSPHSFHTGDSPIGQIDTAQDGWADLERQLNECADRNETLAQFIAIYAPPSQNDTAAYLAFICDGLPLPSTATIAQALAIP